MDNQFTKLFMKSGLAIAAAALVATLTMTPAQAAVITLSPSTPTPGVGSNFSVDVLVTGVFDAPHATDDLFGFGFDISALPPGVVSYLGYTTGPLFNFLLLPGTDVGGISQAPSITPPVGEPLLLATLNFLAVGPGPVVLSISADPIGSSGFEGLQYLSGTDDIEASTTLDVVAAADVPEPGSILLTAAGLILVAFRFIKR